MVTRDSLFGLDGLGVGSAEAVLISAAIAGLVALLVVGRHRSIAKKLKAYEIAESFFAVERLKAEAKLQELAKRQNISDFFDSDDEDAVETRQEIGRYLNECELICVAIKQNIAHEGVLKDIIGDRLVHIYRYAENLIAMIRILEEDDEFYEHFEDVAQKWRSNT